MTQQIKDIFNQRYNQDKWKQFLGKTFANAQLLSTPETLTGIDNHVAAQAQKLGYIILDENGIERQIGVYEVTLAPGIILERNRVGLRNLLRKYWQNIDAAFIAYHRPESANWRFTYVSELTGYDAEGEFIKIKTEPKRYTYLLGESESIRTAVERFERILKKGSKVTLDDVKEAFSVEKLSKTFFDEYKKHYDIFCQYMVSQPGISQTIFNGDEKAIRDFNKKLLGRIVFLYFIQKKGWLGVPKNETWGKGDHNFLTNQFKSFPHPELFYQDFLSVLFFDTLNTKRPNDLIELVAGKPCRIPFLNGGLFEEENKNHRNLIFTATLFKNLFNFFDQYNFTIYEDDPNDHTVAVDPEMLGHIFENLLEDNKDKGAYYTPKEIVHYMCQESLIEYLTTWFESHGYNIISYTSIGNPEQLELFPVNQGRQGQLELEIIVESESKQIDRILIEKLLKKNLDDQDQKLIKKYSTEFNNALDRVKICDPAIGSGAFPMGLLHEIFTAKQTLHIFEFGNTTNFNASGVKLNIIQNSIYGVDIERGAVDIARLRFWLSLIVDEPEPKALPNLDYKIVVGNSLVSKLGDDIIDIDWNIDQTAHGLFGHDLAKEQRLLLKKISQEQKEFFSPDSDKKKLSADIRNLKIDLLINQLELMVKTQGQETEPKAVNFKDKKKFVKTTEQYYETIGWKNTITQLKKLKTKPELSLNFFDWKLDFPEVMNEQVIEKVGFDIVIANPPYIGERKHKNVFIDIQNGSNYKYYLGRMDYFYFFYHLGIDLLKNEGSLTFVTTNYFPTASGAKKLRVDIKERTSIIKIINFNEGKVFDSAFGQHNMICILKKTAKKFICETKVIKMMGFINSNILNYVLSCTENNDLMYHKTIEQNDLWDGEESYLRIEGLKSKNDTNDNDINTILNKVSSKATDLLGKICKPLIGLESSLDSVYVVSQEEINSIIDTENERPLFKPIFKNSNITRYRITKKTNRFILYLHEKVLNIENYSGVWRYLKKHEKAIKSRKGANLNGAFKRGNWWVLNTPRLDMDFKSEKIVTPYRTQKLSFALSTEECYASRDVYYIIKNIDVDLKYIISLLNSRLFYQWFYYRGKRKGNILELYAKPLKEVPIYLPNINKQKLFINIVEKILTLKSEGKDTTILEQQIDNLVYKLYELTYEEVKVIDPEFALTEQEYDAIKMEY
ncbi:Eco57I restriction-modification methylase domain-containing protein [Planktothrix agardhii 1806]|uniref:Eco57I restriction-modification methylase domain-containing protein n=1 Tax=Planktothrix agardhii TaxID=1160 RepID=UPI001F33B606|nr:TaqI-like C-terminal specificity domain-containing protein [Planktothrix agardhii]MCF3569731.1 Eco57I restriction-modification methylase domain-containing protein [Planktothrix agardhii 1805]MCF3571837.1 Eco57I restriction-modification methylase domain-containing protein [Planktothrix agardhii 1805]MCF3585269.1 Eco57I restriction-modification methylase domain-containing protein [Planktothrix agardhii 1803]MCF3601949.1 Eco57I restriction-modification methylase domain-containing protein [Plank